MFPDTITPAFGVHCMEIPVSEDETGVTSADSLDHLCYRAKCSIGRCGSEISA